MHWRNLCMKPCGSHSVMFCVALCWSVLFVADTTTISTTIFDNVDHSLSCVKDCRAPGIGLASRMVNNLAQDLIAGKCSLYDPEIWPEDYGQQVWRDGRIVENFDYVIVGAGSAGSVVASRLSENPQVKVLVLEIGDNPPLESEMFSQSNFLLVSKYAFRDYAEPNEECCQAMLLGRCFWGRGKMIGGTGGINGNLFLPGNRENFDNWQQAGNTDWSWDEALYYYSKALSQQGNESHPKGSLTLNYFNMLPEYEPVNNLIFKATKELGLPQLHRVREGQLIGYTFNINATIAQGRRMSTGKTYLAKVAPSRSNLKVIKNAEVWNVRFDSNQRAIGVDFTLLGLKNFFVPIRNEVILSAGTFGTPKLLMLSGIGPRQHLQAMHIPVRKDLQVGENLQDHGLMPLFLKITRGSLKPTEESDQNQNVLDYFLHGKGPLGSYNSIMGFVNSDPTSNSSYPDLQLVSHQFVPANDYKIYISLGLKPKVAKAIQKVAGQKEILIIFASLFKSKSRGRVRLRSSNHKDKLRIFNNYRDHNDDKKALVRYVRYVQRLERTDAFQEYGIELLHVPLEDCKTFVNDSDDYWNCYFRFFTFSCWHPVGTCKMGPRRDPDAVVDERLRVHAVRGLRVIDASIMPTITSGNTNGPTIMIAEKGSDMIKRDSLDKYLYRS